ncbi:MAG: site-2 protease family protein [Oscillospiraceae bacterium]
MSNRIIIYAIRALVMLLAIPVHESAHALVSSWLGDSTAKDNGRLTLNPMAHFDLLGAMCMILTGFGWARPVPIGANRFKHPKLGMAVSALAGPVSNLLLGYFGYIAYKLTAYTLTGRTQSILLLFFQTFVLINVMLAVFNLIPVPPLDGSRIALAFLPQRIYFSIMRYEKYIFLALFVVLAMGVLNLPISIVNNFFLDMFNKGTMFIDYMFIGTAM